MAMSEQFGKLGQIYRLPRGPVALSIKITEQVPAFIFVLCFLSGFSGYFGKLLTEKWGILGFAGLAIGCKTLRNASLRYIPVGFCYWLYLYGMITVLWWFLFPPDFDAQEEFKDRTVFIVFSGTAMLILAGHAACHAARWAALVVGVISVTINLIDLVYPGHFSETAYRAAGMYRNPNLSAAVLTFTMVLSTSILRQNLRKYWVLLIGIGVASTFSRGGLLTYAVAASALLYFGVLGTTRPIPIVAAASLLFGFVIVSAAEIETIGQWTLEWLNADVAGRLQFFISFALDDQSSASRVTLAQAAIADFMRSPWIGTGLSHLVNAFGMSDIAGAHNTYLALIRQHGVFGLILIAGLLASLMDPVSPGLKPIRATFVIALMSGLTFSHNLLDARPSSLAIVLMACWIACSNKFDDSNKNLTLTSTAVFERKGPRFKRSPNP